MIVCVYNRYCMVMGGKDCNKYLSENDFVNKVIDGELEDNKKFWRGYVI